MTTRIRNQRHPSSTEAILVDRHNPTSEQMRRFEQKHAEWYQNFMFETRKKTFIETLRQKPLPICALLFECTYMIVCTMRLSAPVSSSDSRWNLLNMTIPLVTAIVSGIYVSSLITGLLHMIFDHVPLSIYSDSLDELPIMQKTAIGFQLHHAVQNNWQSQDVFSHGVLVVGSIGTTMGCIFFLLLQAIGKLSFYTSIGILSFCLFALNTQVIHAFAHNTFASSHPRAHAIYKVLASTGLVLDPKHHNVHHSRFDCNFCITNGWADPVVNCIYSILLRNGYIAKEMYPEEQRKTFLRNKGALKKPYYQIFAEWNALQKKITATSNSDN